MDDPTPPIDESKVTTAIISSSPMFKLVKAGDHVLVSDWFKKLGRPAQEYLDAFGTKQAIGRINKYVDAPLILRRAELAESKDLSPETTEGGAYIYVHKFMVVTVLDYLDNDDLRMMIGDKMPDNILITKMSESLLIRTTDGWFSATAFAAHFKKDPLEFVRTDDVIRIIKRFGSIVRVETNDIKDRRNKTVWCHPILLVNAMKWISEPAALELLAGYFMYSNVPLPDTDALTKLAKKHAAQHIE